MDYVERFSMLVEAAVRIGKAARYSAAYEDGEFLWHLHIYFIVEILKFMERYSAHEFQYEIIGPFAFAQLVDLDDVFVN